MVMGCPFSYLARRVRRVTALRGLWGPGYTVTSGCADAYRREACVLPGRLWEASWAAGESRYRRVPRQTLCERVLRMPWAELRTDSSGTPSPASRPGRLALQRAQRWPVSCFVAWRNILGVCCGRCCCEVWLLQQQIRSQQTRAKRGQVGRIDVRVNQQDCWCWPQLTEALLWSLVPTAASVDTGA
jgi:hypothetical protein